MNIQQIVAAPMAINPIRCRTIKKIKSKGERRLYRVAYKYLIGDTKVDFEKIYKEFKFIYAFIDEKPVGLIEYEQTKNATHLNMVYVLSKYRQLGIMRRMFRHIFRNHDVLVWKSSTEAKKAYAKIGATVNCGVCMRLKKEDFIK